MAGLGGIHSPVRFEPSPAMTRRNTIALGGRGGANRVSLSAMNSMELRKTFKQISIGKIDEEPNSANSKNIQNTKNKLDEKRASLHEKSEGDKSR